MAYAEHTQTPQRARAAGKLPPVPLVLNRECDQHSARVDESRMDLATQSAYEIDAIGKMLMDLASLADHNPDIIEAYGLRCFGLRLRTLSMIVMAALGDEMAKTEDLKKVLVHGGH